MPPKWVTITVVACLVGGLALLVLVKASLS